jgi:PPK2 family polyphosphate:nucleotide phosphotransferase
MSGVDPQGCEVFSFKTPSEEELKHDLFWRTACRLPEHGRIGIFNRSYYEEVLVVRVHPETLDAENLPDDSRNDQRIWGHRFRSISDLEKHLHRNGTHIVKIFLHLSKNEQKKRSLTRIADPEKNCKFSHADIHEREYWSTYAKVYELALSATNTREAPWYIVPADEKFNSRLIVSTIVMNALDELKMSYPKPAAKARREILSAGRKLENRSAAASPARPKDGRAT